MGVRIHFRTDGEHYADLKTYGWTREKFIAEYPDRVPDYVDLFESIPTAQPGDIWMAHWYKESGEKPLAGYAICCVKCGHVHKWTTAGNCQTDVQEVHYKDQDGADKSYSACVHRRTGTGSCWIWTGSAGDGTLSASPSLLVTSPECGWHGWLRDGELVDC